MNKREKPDTKFAIGVLCNHLDGALADYENGDDIEDEILSVISSIGTLENSEGNPAMLAMDYLHAFQDIKRKEIER